MPETDVQIGNAGLRVLGKLGIRAVPLMAVGLLAAPAV
jgi:hypothetical protein